ncbi:RNA-binding protein [Ancylobacter mangrovi]|uniref:RNA-binding protein n=1 Tax=Ancylobacter mangrovi TaxID=2972472 RepID=UPI002163C270|nr:RNA-binding protein [Ancylobacter mangrovi]MCS0502445.1 RNA-binding protein [Ancylobacter mangrovi]
MKVRDEAGPTGMANDGAAGETADAAGAACSAPEAASDRPAGDAASPEDETDAGPASARRVPERQCIASRTVRPVAEMLRFVVAPDGRVVPDIAGRLPGRGAWVGASRGALAEALKRKAFGRAFKGKGRTDPALPELVEQLLEKDALAALGLANKAGQVVTGFMKVVEALDTERKGAPVHVLVHSREAGADGVAKIDAQARKALALTGREIARIDSLPGVQLDLALGRANVVHAALLAHPTSAGFLARVRRLEGWRAP